MKNQLDRVHIQGETRKALVEAVNDAVERGVTISQACKILGICTKRFSRWSKRGRKGEWHREKNLERQHKPYNALTPREREIVDQLIRSKEYADKTTRDLMMIALHEEGVYISHVTFWNVMQERGVNGPRGVAARRREPRQKPETDWATEPNQLWAWDITYLRTTQRNVFYYLYTLLDCISRKVIAWRVSDRLCSEEAQSLWDDGIISEGLLDSPPEKLHSLSDRGAQMRSNSTMNFFTQLGIKQLFSRPRTPNDNPQIEALFSTTKNHPDYPGVFKCLADAKEYFERFFHWYNYEHYHTSLNQIQPALFHEGKAPEILEERRKIRQATMARRREHNTKLA